ncbi:MAG: winged helix-turn-helix domain-containing protein [Bryobacterales bacterium]|nr:winged helix-turn-helix domain-containing protein [Bryobacterales bacterium]
MNDETKDLILAIFEASLEAQLRAVRHLRRDQPASAALRRRKGLSQVDMAFDILKKARSPLHVSDLLSRIQAQFSVTVDRESLVSSLTKKVARGDRFLRPDKNTFSLKADAR